MKNCTRGLTKRNAFDTIDYRISKCVNALPSVSFQEQDKELAQSVENSNYESSALFNWLAPYGLQKLKKGGYENEEAKNPCSDYAIVAHKQRGRKTPVPPNCGRGEASKSSKRRERK